jgi:CDP-diacylglycerol--serine O-phosphatidyltransferase
MLRFWNRANALTLCGLAAGLLCALLAAEGRLAHAVVALVCAGLCDLFDGFVARRMQRSEEVKAFGGHLDSVVDACNFGLAPTLLLHGCGMRSAPEIAALVFFTSCAAWRLAYFDTIGLSAEGDTRYYTGLPTTFTALVLPLLLLSGFASATALRIAANAGALGLGLAMTSGARIPKPGGKWYAVLLAIAVAMIGVYGGLAARFAGS